MDDSSGDDQPIGARQIVRAAERLLQQDNDSNDSGSPMPEWISQHTPKEKSKPEAESSSESEGIVDLVSPAEKEKQEAEPDKQRKTDLKGRQKGSQAVKKVGPSKLSKPSELPPAGLSQANAQLPAIPLAASGSGRIPIMMPEKLTKGRFLVELEPAEEGATDLAGDAGAVGRFSSSGAEGSGEGMLLDLKGCIYSASLVPCASTLCIINLGQTEAKVEAMFDSFVSLKEETNGAGRNEADGNNLFMFDDEDNYQVDEDGERVRKPQGKRKATKEAEDKPAAKKKRAAPKGKATKAGKSKPAKRKAPAKKPGTGKK